MRKTNVTRRIVVILSMVLVSLMFMGNSGCEMQEVAPSSYDTAAKANEDAVNELISNDVLPVITESLERGNVNRRAEFINQPDRIGYLYLITTNGQLIKEVQILGKVSSLNSYLTPMEEIKIVDSYGKVYSPSNFPSMRTVTGVVTVQAPDLDGTYGENAEGIFWFTPDGVYQEWSGMYFYSSERMTFITQPLLVEQVK